MLIFVLLINSIGIREEKVTVTSKEEADGALQQHQPPYVSKISTNVAHS